MKRSQVFTLVFCISMFTLGLITLTLFLQNPQGSQRSLLFPDQDDYFMDFFNTLNYTANRNPYQDGYGGLVNRNYLPLAYLILYPFSKLGDFIHELPKEIRPEQAAMIGCFVFLLLSFGLFFYLMYEGKSGRRLEKLFTTLACACSGLILYNIDRANTIILAVAFLWLYLLFYRDENPVYRHIALVGLAISAALKVYPAIFGVLLLYEKRWKDTAWAILYGIIAVFLPFLFFEEGFAAVPQLLYNVQLNSKKYYGGSFSIVTNHILDTTNLLSIGFGIAKVLMVLIAAMAWLQEKFWKRILLLTCALLLSPTHSGYYCGLYLFIPLIFFLNEEDHSNLDWLYLVLFILAVSPLQFRISLPETRLFRTQFDNFMLQNMAAIGIYLSLIIETLYSAVKQWNLRKRQVVT